MGLIAHFDFSTDFTQFFVVGAALMMTFAVLLSRVAPAGRNRKGRSGKVDDSVIDRTGELID